MMAFDVVSTGMNWEALVGIRCELRCKSFSTCESGFPSVESGCRWCGVLAVMAVTFRWRPPWWSGGPKKL